MSLVCAECGRPMEMVSLPDHVPPEVLVDVHPPMKSAAWSTNAACPCGSNEWMAADGDGSERLRIPPGGWVRGDGGSLDIGLVREQVAADPDPIEFISEEWE